MAERAAASGISRPGRRWSPPALCVAAICRLHEREPGLPAGGPGHAGGVVQPGGPRWGRADTGAAARARRRAGAQPHVCACTWVVAWLVFWGGGCAWAGLISSCGDGTGLMWVMMWVEAWGGAQAPSSAEQRWLCMRGAACNARAPFTAARVRVPSRALHPHASQGSVAPMRTRTLLMLLACHVCPHAQPPPPRLALTPCPSPPPFPSPTACPLTLLVS